MWRRGLQAMVNEMTKRLAPHVLKKLLEVGEALDIGRQLAVGHGGEVFVNEEESAQNAKRECEGPAGGQGSQRGSGERLRTRQEAAPGSPARLRGKSLAEHYLLEEGEVSDRYGGRFLPSRNGLWVVAPSSPLGPDGPQFHLAVYLPFVLGRRPQGWAFSKLGQFPKVVGPRHTNFPDHSICAQGDNDGAWYPPDGLIALLNLYSTWLFRHLYLAEVGRWPGLQWGASALYRRTEFHPEDWCGCGKAARYRDCCQASDLEVPEEEAREEHVRLTGGPYVERRVPAAIMTFARSGWKKVPQAG